MKKFVALVCIISLLATMLVPIQVSAIRSSSAGGSNWTGWTTTGNAKIEGNTATVTGIGTLQYSYANQPTKMTVNFSMKVNTHGTTSYFWVADGVARAGFYIQNGRLLSGDTQEGVSVSNMDQWHDYTLEIDTDNMVQYVYVDGTYLGMQNLKSTPSRGKVEFGVFGSSGEYEVENVTFTNNKVAEDGLLELTEDYTEAFVQDWNSKGGWVYEKPSAIELDEEAGIVTMSQGPLFESNPGSYSLTTLERPLRATENYDMEWRMKLTDIHALGGQPGMTALECSTDDRHFWLYFYHGKIWHNGVSDDTMKDYGYSMAYSSHDGEWHTWKAEVRGRFVTWYMDDQMLFTHHIRFTQTNRWHTIVFQQNAATFSSQAQIDWIKYTPYMDEVKIIEPKNQSRVAESKKMTLRSTAPSGTEFVDYFIGNTSLGRGYAPDFELVVENMKIGTYDIYAKAGDKKSVSTTVYVKPAFNVAVNVSKEQISMGESVTASVSVDSISEELKATSVDYYVNGNKMVTSNTAPFNVTFSDFKVGTANIYAKVTNSAGSVIESEPVYVNVDYSDGMTLEMGREYEFDYKYESGSGQVELTDGYFRFSLKHQEDKITYETYDGAKEYPLGKGDYKAVVTSGYAELYYNGQLAFSFFMPRSAEPQKLSHRGVRDVHLGGSNVKAERYSKKWNGEENFSVSVPGTQYYSLEFDKTDSSSETVSFFDGVFENELYFREDGVYAKRQMVLNAAVDEYKLADKTEPGYYRLTVGFGIAQLFRDNQFLGSYRCNKFAHKPEIKRSMTNPSASTIIALKNTDGRFYHIENFENDNEFAYEEYFQMRPSHISEGSVANMTNETVTKNGNSYLKLKGTGVYMFNGISREPDLRFRAMAEKAEGKIYFMLRRSRHDVSDRFGYDFENGQWYTEKSDATGKVAVTSIVEAPGAIEAGKWYDFTFRFDGTDAALFCNGNEVIRTTTEAYYDDVNYGRHGFGAVDGVLCIDDMYYVGEDCPVAGAAIYNSAQFNPISSPALFYKADDGSVIGSGPFETSVTTDKGRTWKTYTAETSQHAYGAQIVVMPDGKLAKINEGGTTVTCQISSDNGRTWSEGVNIFGSFVPNRPPYSSVSRLTCSKDGRLFYITSQGDEDYGYSDIWYSNVGGTEWYKSETVLTTANTGIIMNESILVDAPNGDIWMYGRSDSGFLDYWISKDGGKTFDPIPHHSQLIQSETCFKVLRDWEHDNVYYAIFLYDTETVNERGQQMPRNRISLAVSYDGMETWEYISDLMEMDMVPSLWTSDSNVSLVDNQLYWRSSSGGGYGGDLTGVQDIDKIKTLKRHPELHERTFVGYSVADELAANHCVIPKNGGEAWIYGTYFDVSVEDGRVDLKSAEKIFGVEIREVSGGAEVKIGQIVIKFTEGSASYAVGSETKTSENICLKNGYIDLKTCSELFGRFFRETENSYGILFRTHGLDLYQVQVDNLA